LLDAPASSDQLSFDVSSSSFIEDVSSSPIEPFNLTDSSLEWLIRCSHRLHHILTIILLLILQSLLFLSQLLIMILFFIRNCST
jgi:hypothetical protein